MIVARNRSRPRRGFALVITVILLSLLLLVLVSTATLTQIETSIGFNSRRASQAQQNALFALNRAIGELQRHAGPDERVTARADITSSSIANPYWTGVWNSDDGDLRTWLVSGNEELDPASGGFNQASASITGATLVGTNSAGSSSALHVVAPLVTLTGDAPGGDSGTTADDVPLGRYAWWVSDDGVKASVALPDRLNEVDYGPYAVDENRQRLRQQIPLTHESFRATGAAGSPKFGFDPASNIGALRNVVARNQLAFLTKAATETVLTGMKERFHDWTATSLGVLASTNPVYPGLKRDLSMDPGQLGEAFTAWQDYASYMEDPASPLTPVADPPLDPVTDLRRRYRISGAVPASLDPGDLVFSSAPTLAEILMQFGVRRVGGGSLEVGVRMVVSLWNPYTSALVPEDLQLRISDLPTIMVSNPGGTPAESQEIDLQAVLSGSPSLPFVVTLPWNPLPGTDLGSASEKASWLPGRVYYWRTRIGIDEDIGTLAFFAKGVGSANGWNYQPSGVVLPTSGTLHLHGEPSTTGILNVEVRNSDGLLLTSVGPMLPVAAWDADVSLASETVSLPPARPVPEEFWSFGYGFRLKQPFVRAGTETLNGWLVDPPGDPRGPEVIAAQLSEYSPGFGTMPTNYKWDVSTTFDGDGSDAFLFHRATGTSPPPAIVTTFDNDTPVFELPRSPVLSLGMLQHLQVAGARPFAIGNSWGADIPVPLDGNRKIGTLFDRFFFSGVPPESVGWGPDLAAGQPFPYFHLRKFDPTGDLTLSTFRSAGDVTSRHLLMMGAFNVNSTSVDAWAAVLKSLRPTIPVPWPVAWDGNNPSYWKAADLREDTGTISSPGVFSVQIEDLTQGERNDLTNGLDKATETPAEIAARAVGFFRFSQTAQETFESSKDSPSGSTESTPSNFNRSRWRMGFRGGDSGEDEHATRNLTSVQLDALAAQIVARIRTHGPFRSMEDFVKPLPGSSPSQSLLEQAISTVVPSINAGISEGSSQFLTQADILTAIGPMLQNRSDTFLIRAYGEANNPVVDRDGDGVGDVEARAWCEATVQRIPTPVEASTDDIVQPTGPFGRRFQIVSFRWLSPADI